jgi:hypothetical protein
MSRITSSLLCAVLAVGLMPMAACWTAEDPAVEDIGEAEDELAGDPIGPAPGGGVFTTNCEAACNGAGVICGTVQDPFSLQTCCCIGGCLWWAQECADGVNSGAIGVGASPVGDGGVFTAMCESSCNSAGVTCGTVAAPTGQTCCCIGTCPQNANACAMGVARGQIQAGVIFQAEAIF